MRIYLSKRERRYNSAASRDREEPPLIHRSSQSPISKGEHGCSNIRRDMNSHGEIRNNKIMIMTVAQSEYKPMGEGGMFPGVYPFFERESAFHSDK